MAGDWILVGTMKKNDWNIPNTALAELAARRGTAAAALAAAKNETTRIPAANDQCRETFDALTAAMRDFKRRYFLSPPLTGADYIRLGLKFRDTAPTAGGTPTA
jgi:cytosine/adenosine deaminase-related metal-dependent hydrolase